MKQREMEKKNDRNQNQKKRMLPDKAEKQRAEAEHFRG